jgi:DNA-binding NtrC family response regulator
MARLMAYPFPGNVRELENAVEHAFVVCCGTTIEADDLPPHIAGEPVPGEDGDADGLSPLERAEATAIRVVLNRHHGHRGRAARDLGISRNTLWRKMKSYQVH